MSTQDQHSLPGSQDAVPIRIQDAVTMITPPNAQATHFTEDAQMIDLDLDMNDFPTEDTGNNAIMEVQLVLANLNDQALEIAIKFNEAWLKKEKENIAKYKKLADEINDQIRTFNQTLHRVKTINTKTNPMKSEVDTEATDSFLRLNYKDLPHFQLESWSAKPYPSEHAYQSVDTYLWDLEKLVNMSSNISLHKHWKHILPLVVDDKHARWIQDTVRTAITWEEAKEAFKLKFKSTRATVNATTEALTMTMTKKETIADYTTRFINKCEQAELALDEKGIVERFVASMTPEIHHQVAASWLPLRRTNDPLKWNVNEAAAVARELLGDCVDDYYSFYDGGRFGSGARQRTISGGQGDNRSSQGGQAPTNSVTRPHTYYCKYHGKNSSHTTIDCEQRRRQTKNVFYGERNLPRTTNMNSGAAQSRWAQQGSDSCRYCKKAWVKGHRCPEYFESEEYKRRLQHKQVNMLRACRENEPTTDKKKDSDDDEDMNEFLGDVEA